MTTRPRWSYSALTQYLRCPLQYYFQRILGLKPAFTPSSLVLGSSVHEALAVYHRAIQQDEPIAQEAIQKSFIDAWKARKSQENIRIDEEDKEQVILDQG